MGTRIWSPSFQIGKLVIPIMRVSIMDSRFPRVSIIVLNWNGWKDTVECLESLYQIAYSNYDVVVVDNGSSDDSVGNIELYAKGKIEVKSKFVKYDVRNKPMSVAQYVRSPGISPEFEEKEVAASSPNRKLVLIKNDENLGFAEGNNVGIRFALSSLDPAYILLLNNDVVVAHDFLDEMIVAAEAHPETGILSPKTYFYDRPNTIQWTWNRVDLARGRVFLAGAGELDHGQFDEVVETDYSPGVCFLMKRSIIDRIGLLDSVFFCYSEESDYCFRARKNGITSLYVPKARIWHKFSQSANKVDGFVLYYATRNRFWFTRRHASPTQYGLFVINYLGVDFWKTILSLVAKHASPRSLKSYLRGVLAGLLGVEKS